MMSAERGRIGEPQPARQWHDSHYSREADRIPARQAREMRDMEEVGHGRQRPGSE
jgi:hypothetical protein